jgi:ribulose bisphosphate carboxylase small subunit
MIEELRKDISAWRYIIEECERGWRGIPEEYENDMDYRNSIQELVGKIPGVKIKKELSELNELDNRFNKILIPGNIFFGIEHLKDRYPKERYWWLYGLPRSIKFED